MATTLQLPPDVETWTAGARRRVRARAVPGPRRARVLVPEGGDRPPRHALRGRAEGARLRDRHAPSLPRDVRALAGDRGALRHDDRDFAGEPVEDGPWEKNPDLYLANAKVEPLNRALLDLDCWITGIRRDQSPTRADAPSLGWDYQHELWKANPLADWTDDDCWAYIRERGLPYNALHDKGYDSIGDTHSTAPGKGREGRWAGTERTECGLHT